MLNLAAYHNSPVRSTKSTPSDFNVLRLLVSARFQVLFHSPSGVLFTFPSRYYALSVATRYLALEGGPPRFQQGFSCPAVLEYHIHAAQNNSPTGLSPSVTDLPRSFDYTLSLSLREVNRLTSNATSQPQHCNAPTLTQCQFRLFPLRSPLLRESHLISFPAGT